MTSEFGDDLSGHSQRPSVPPKQIWSKADFLHQAQILARRLAVWHVDDDGPVWAPKGTDFLREVERAFRYRVLQGQHDPEATYSGPIRLVPNPPPDNSQESIAGEAVILHSDQYRKDETIWLFRDFYEHLSQLGESESEKLLRLKVEQLLDCRMYRRARSEVFGNYLAGHQVDQLLLDELIEAAKDAALSTMHSPNPGGQSVDSVADITAKLLSKKRMFEQFRDRFKAIESKNAFLIELRLIERCWFPSPEHRNLLQDFSEVQDSTGWKLIEQHEGTAISGNCHQVVLYVRNRDLSGSNQLPFEKWKSIAVLAGNELDKYAPVTEDRTSIRGVSGWVWWMKQLVEGGILNLPMKTKHLDEVLYLSAISAEKRDGADNKNRVQASKLMELAERNGRVTRCTDAMTASILLADWLSCNNWPVESSSVVIAANCSADVVSTGGRPRYKWKEHLAEDAWIYENIHSNSLDDLKAEHNEQCQSSKHFGKLLSRRAYWARADRYAEYHGLPTRRFKGACKCPDCQPVTDTPLTGD